MAWSLGWLASWGIGIDVERSYEVFGASGALVVTLLTGLALRALLGEGGALRPGHPRTVATSS